MEDEGRRWQRRIVKAAARPLRSACLAHVWQYDEQEFGSRKHFSRKNVIQALENVLLRYDRRGLLEAGAEFLKLNQFEPVFHHLLELSYPESEPSDESGPEVDIDQSDFSSEGPKRPQPVDRSNDVSFHFKEDEKKCISTLETIEDMGFSRHEVQCILRMRPDARVDEVVDLLLTDPLPQSVQGVAGEEGGLLHSEQISSSKKRTLDEPSSRESPSKSLRRGFRGRHHHRGEGSSARPDIDIGNANGLNVNNNVEIVVDSIEANIDKSASHAYSTGDSVRDAWRSKLMAILSCWGSTQKLESLFLDQITAVAAGLENEVYESSRSVCPSYHLKLRDIVSDLKASKELRTKLVEGTLSPKAAIRSRQ